MEPLKQADGLDTVQRVFEEGNACAEPRALDELDAELPARGGWRSDDGFDD